MDKKISYFNKAVMRGYVQNFTIKTLKSGKKLANITFKDELTNNVTFASMFDRKGLKYGDDEVTLETLKKIFMNQDDKPRHILVEAVGRVNETKGVDKNGNEKVYVNTIIFSIKPLADESKQCSILSVTGVVDAVKYSEDKDGNPIAKLRVGVANYNKDKNIVGVSGLTIVAHDDMADELESRDVDKSSVVSLKCDMLNIMGEVDRFGDIVGAPKKEIAVAKISFVNTEDELDENDLENYKKAKKLKNGEVLEINKNKDEESELLDDIDDVDIDF